MPHAISKLLSSPPRFLLATTLTTVAAACIAAPQADALVTPNAAVGAKQMCAYTNNSISGLVQFASAIGAPSVNCGEVYDYGSTWSTWVDPFFIAKSGDTAWSNWVSSAPSGQPRQLVISLSLGPTSESTDPNWRSEGASGEDDGYATQLATNLVQSGLGNSVIVLAAEANGTWDADNIGTTPQNMSDWVSYWRNTVTSMRAVPGAAFTFVWTVNDRVPAIPFSEYYPGNDVVNVIGDDVYDNSAGWSWSYGGAEGLGSLISFAQTNGKPLGFPEWGTGNPTSSNPTGDDPQFVQGMAQVVQTDNVAFQSYFYKYGWATQLTGAPLSLAAFRSAFVSDSTTTATAPASSAPSTAPTTTTGSTPTGSATTSGSHAGATTSTKPGTSAPSRSTTSAPTKPAGPMTAKSASGASAKSLRAVSQARSRRVRHRRPRHGRRTHRDRRAHRSRASRR